MVVEEKAFTRIKSGDGGHILVGECEIEYVDILLHPLYVGRFGDDDAVLDEPTQGDLRHAFAVLAADFCKHRIREETVAPLGKRSPRHDARAELFHDLLRLDLLVEDVRFHLIDRRNDFHVAGDVDEMVGGTTVPLKSEKVL